MAFTFHAGGNGRAPIKIWCDGVSVEEQAMDQLGNIAGLPFIHKHVAAMPDVHLGKGATVGSVIATKGAIVPAAVGVDIGCFVGETKIPLLDGSQRTLRDLATETNPFWVYSIDKNLKIAPGRAVCVKTRSDAELVKVVVSGGEEIVCTPDHQFMLWNGSYKEARDLKFNDSLMPLYRRWQTRDGYESVNNGRKGGTKQTHVMVWEYFNGALPSGDVVHHKDHIHFNNIPSNLEAMTQSDHSAYHRRVGKKLDNNDPEFQRRRMIGIAARSADPEKRAAMAEVGAHNIAAYMSDRHEEFKDAVKDNGNRGAPFLEKFNTSPRACDDCGEVSINPSVLRWHKRREHGYNHKVLSMTPVDRRDDVYCLHVDEHHNFALSAGVFVHNCGMCAWQLSLSANDLPDNLHAIRSDIEAAVPHGRTDNGGKNDRGAWGNLTPENADRWQALADGYEKIVAKHPKAKSFNGANHLGSLGTGNHFIELCLDENDRVWVMLHSGSRGAGNKIGTYFIDRAKEEMRRYYIDRFLPDQDFAYLVEHSDLFDDYVEAVHWAQEFAWQNRLAMMDATLAALRKHLPAFDVTQNAINCHHNYIAKENHFGANVWVTRKGAVRARETDLGIIPGSMGTGSFIVRGKGNAESFCSCSHGAGRRMSRGEAKKKISLEDHAKAVAGIECRLDADVLDESPAAYKDVNAVMAAQDDLVEIVHRLRQILNVKG